MKPSRLEAKLSDLATQAETFNQRTVAGNINALKVPEQTATLPDEEQEAATRVVVVLVRLEVLGELVDAVGEQSNLDFWRPSISGTSLILLDDGLFDLRGDTHQIVLFLSLRGATSF